MAVLDDLIELVELAEERYRQGAREVADRDLRLLFATLAGERAAMAAELAGQACRLDGRLGRRRPRPASPFSSPGDSRMRPRDPRVAWLAECEEADRLLAERMRTAMTASLPDPTRPAVNRLHYDVTATIGRLAAARLRL